MQLASIEDKAVDLEKKFAEIDIINMLQSPGILLHMSEEGLRDSQKKSNRLNEEMQKLLETLDGVNLLPDQHGKYFGLRQEPKVWQYPSGTKLSTALILYLSGLDLKVDFKQSLRGLEAIVKRILRAFL